ncbi:MAG: hypothetical protein D3923_05890, partial [Candidatus Electrothrix sp. AR3]|nr:hypothetical protein [Candidatus Electrothrix sp. AR3]
EKKLLQKAALSRCKEIVLRDLEPANRDRRIYRGPLRSIYNWQRYQCFCTRIDQQEDERFRENVAQALASFFAKELADVQAGRKKSSVNCTDADLLAFTQQLDLTEQHLPSGWQELCLP